jgi:proteasome lid subunit RPN8/RPN11
MYTHIFCQCVDVFAMPQSGTSVTVESVDHVFQTKMLDMLKQTGRPEMVVGWYHSHPGFGCWLSNVDVNTQQVCQTLKETIHEGSLALLDRSRSNSSTPERWLSSSTRFNPFEVK